MDCTLFRQLLDSYLEEALDEERRAAFRNHLGACATCRRWAVAAEPSLLFAAVGEPPADEDRAQLCAAVVAAEIRQQRVRRRLARRRAPWLAAAAAAVLVICGSLIWRLVPVVVTPGDQASGPGTEGGAAPPVIEVEMPGEGVRVYQFASEDDPDTAAYFIVNPALEL